MQAKHFSLFRTAGLMAGATLALSAVRLSGADASTEAFPTFTNYVKLSGQSASVTGNDASFQARTQQAKAGGVGIEDLHFSKDVTKAVNLQIDGRALIGAEDYLAQIRLSKNEVGTFEAGFKSFRTFYDGVGGFFPVNKQWMPLTPEALHLDRSKFYANATVALPGKPVFTLRYDNELRSGRKDSTIWGTTDYTGLPNVYANPDPLGVNRLLSRTPARKIVASYIDVGERHEELQGTMKQTVGNTTYQLAVLADRVNNLDTRWVVNAPGEMRWVTQPSSNSVIPWSIFTNESAVTHTEGIQTKTFSVTGTTVTTLNQQLTLRTGLSYLLLNSDLSGTRSTVTNTPTNVGKVQVYTSQFFGLGGGSREKIYTGNVGLDYKASKDLFVKLALRGEDMYRKGSANFTDVVAPINTTTGVVTRTDTPRLDWSRIKRQILTPVFDVRYTGLNDVALYASGSQRILNGDERYSTAFNPITASVGTLANNDLSEDHGNFTVGGSWRQSVLLTLRAETFYRDHRNKFVGYSTRVGDNFVLGSQFTGLKLTATAKPNALVTFTTRYVYQTGKMQVTGVIPGAEKYDSMDAKNHTISGTIDWTPGNQFYLQANANVVFNVISTVYPRAGYTAASATVAGFDSNKVLQDSNNNYVTGSLLVGVAMDKDNDFQAQATYYRANNGDAALANWAQPYGADAKEFVLTVGLKHKFSAHLVGSARVGFFDCRNNTTGGFTNFKGPVVYFALETGL